MSPEIVHLITGLDVTIGRNAAPMPTAGKSIFNFWISESVHQPAGCYTWQRNSIFIKRKACDILTDLLVSFVTTTCPDRIMANIGLLLSLIHKQPKMFPNKLLESRLAVDYLMLEQQPQSSFNTQ